VLLQVGAHYLADQWGQQLMTLQVRLGRAPLALRREWRGSVGLYY
jgi:hypothetical protein